MKLQRVTTAPGTKITGKWETVADERGGPLPSLYEELLDLFKHGATHVKVSRPEQDIYYRGRK